MKSHNKNGNQIAHKKKGKYMLEVIVLIISIVISAAICKIINRNTIGTTSSYVKRFICVLFFVTLLLVMAANKIGLF